MAESTEEDDARTEIGSVDDPYLGDICVRSLREHGFDANLKAEAFLRPPNPSSIFVGILKACWGRLSPIGLRRYHAIVVPHSQARAAREYLRKSRLLGPE